MDSTFNNCLYFYLFFLQFSILQLLLLLVTSFVDMLKDDQPGQQEEMLAIYVSRNQANVASQHFLARKIYMYVIHVSANSGVFSK